MNLENTLFGFFLSDKPMFWKIKNKNPSVILFLVLCRLLGLSDEEIINATQFHHCFYLRKETTHPFYYLRHCHKVKGSSVMESIEVSHKTLVIAFYLFFIVPYLCIFLKFTVTGVKSLDQIQCFMVIISLIDPFHSQHLNFLFKANDSQILPSIQFYSCYCLLGIP